MAIRGGKAAKVTRMNGEAKIQPIPRDRDNTDDLAEEETRVHAKFSNIRHPGNKQRKGSFDPTSNAAHNGSTITAP